MNSNCPTLLSQPDNVLLDFFTGSHHQVGNFVRDDYDKRQVFGNILSFSTFGSQPLLEFFFTKLVVAGDMANTRLGQECVTLFHFVDSPGQNSLRFPHVRDDGVHQVW